MVEKGFIGNKWIYTYRAEAHSELSQRSNMESFCKIVLTIFSKSSILGADHMEIFRPD